MEDRVYSDDFLDKKSKDELRKLMDQVKVHDELTSREKDKNIEKIEFYINGGNSARDIAIAKDMLEGQADISDLGSM